MGPVGASLRHSDPAKAPVDECLASTLPFIPMVTVAGSERLSILPACTGSHPSSEPSVVVRDMRGPVAMTAPLLRPIGCVASGPSFSGAAPSMKLVAGVVGLEEREPPPKAARAATLGTVGSAALHPACPDGPVPLRSSTPAWARPDDIERLKLFGPLASETSLL